MSFHPESLTEKTLKDLAKNLKKGASTVLSNEGIKLSQAQEILAKTLNHPCWHVALKKARTKEKKNLSIDRVSLASNMRKLAQEMEQEAAVLLQKTCSYTPNERTLLFCRKLEECLIKEKFCFGVEGTTLSVKEATGSDAMLACLLDFSLGTDIKPFVLHQDHEALLTLSVEFLSGEKTRQKIINQIVSKLRSRQDHQTNGVIVMDDMYQDFLAHLKEGHWTFV